MSDEGIVQKNTAKSGKVHYTQPIVIRGGPRATTHFDVLPTFIPRSSGSEEVCLKFRYWKETKGTMRVGHPAEFSLTASEVQALKEVIDKSMAVSGNSDGKYLLIRLDDAEATDIQGKDTTVVGRALLKLLSNPQIGESIAGMPSTTALIDGVQTAIRMRTLASAIAELQDALDSGVVDEAFYQRWCETNAWAFGNAYVMRDEVRNIALGDAVDILLKRVTDQFRDVFELKRPDHDVIKYDQSHKSYFWSGETSRTIGQCHRYLDALHEVAANGLRDHPEILAYYPYGTIVIGRSHTWEHKQQKALHGLNARLHSIRVITYDHLLEQAKRALGILREADSQASDMKT
jgi:hypothetical protein